MAINLAMREQDLLKRLGQQIRTYRRSAGLTLEKLAERIGVSYRTIADIERGLQFTSLANLYQISRAVGCDLSDLFTWASAKREPTQAAAEKTTPGGDSRKRPTQPRRRKQVNTRSRA